MKKTNLLAIVLLLTLAPAAAAKDNTANVLDVTRSITDPAIIFPESFEVDTQKLLESWYMKNYTSTDTRYRTAPDVKVSDEVIIKRLQALPTVIQMPFNQIVRQYIDRYTTGAGRAQVAALLGLSHYYMPIFEQALEQEGLPLELKYMPVIESALNPNAVSKHGAAGLWQFMLASAKGLGMEVNSLVDERRDPFLASEKAASLLKNLYSTYGDWSLAIAAYNCGPNAVNKAIRRAGGEPKNHNFWTIYNYLPSETRGYVPMFIAANYAMTYYKDHNISPVLATKPLVTDTVAVNARVHFDQISKVLDIPSDELRVLNPQFRADIIPGSPENPYYLILPSQQVHAYIMSENDILNYDAAKYAPLVTVEPGLADAQPAAKETVSEPEVKEVDDITQVVAESVPAPAGYRTIMHKVGPDESLATIAQKYNVSPADIKTWNSLRRNAIRTGQQLRIQVASNSKTAKAQSTPTKVASRQEETAAVANNKNYEQTAPAQKKTKEQIRKEKEKEKKAAAQKKKKEKAKPINHTIKDGENLTVIAKKYGTTVEEIQKANNMTGDNIRAGRNITIPAKAGKKGITNAKKNNGGNAKKSSRKRRR